MGERTLSLFVGVLLDVLFAEVIELADVFLHLYSLKNFLILRLLKGLLLFFLLHFNEFLDVTLLNNDDFVHRRSPRVFLSKRISIMISLQDHMAPVVRRVSNDT